MFNKLTIWQRLVLLSLAFLVPVLALLYFLVREQNVAIDFARKELAGIEYLRVIRPLLWNLLAERDLQMARRTGDLTRADELARRIEAIDSSFGAAVRRSGNLSIPLVSTKKLETIRQMWGEGTRNGTIPAGGETPVIEEALRHVVAVGNESNLVLDPDVDSYYSMDAVVFKLPKLLMEMSDARGQAFEILRGLDTSSGGLAEKERQSLQALAVSIAEALSAARDNIEYGLRFNPTMEQQLGPRYRQSLAQAERITTVLAGSVEGPTRADDLFAEITATIDGTFATYDATLDTLQQLIDLRIAGFERRRFISFSFVIPSLVIGLWIVFSLQRHMEARNRDLVHANEQHDRVIAELEQTLHRFEVQTAELARSNSDLQQFAYVASHDLQEPLRIVSSYAQLFEQRYKAHVDEKGQKWIFYMVDASKRMQRLIEDLLAYSRVGTKGKEPVPVDSKKCVQDALANLRLAIQRNGAHVTQDEMPEVLADSLQLTQLFQNLVGNALKYRGEEPPAIHIGGRPAGRLWHFSVRDNGIGIDPRFHDRIFGLFQRLHERGKYEGTGIGLAICKKIVERHGGTIWVESHEDKGTTFHFTLPLA